MRFSFPLFIGEARMLRFADMERPRQPSPREYQGRKLLRDFRIDPETGEPTSREVPEEQRIQERWEALEQATLRFYGIAGKAQELLNRLPEGEQKQELQSAYRQYLALEQRYLHAPRQGEQREWSLEPTEAAPAWYPDPVEINALNTLIGRFERKMQGGIDLYGRIAAVRQKETDEARQRFDAVVRMKGAAGGVQDAMAKRAVATEARTYAGYIDHEQSYRAQGSVQENLPRVMTLMEEKVRALEQIEDAEPGIASTANVLQAVMQESAYLMAHADALQAGERMAALAARQQRAEAVLQDQFRALGEMISNQTLLADPVAAKRELDGLASAEGVLTQIPDAARLAVVQGLQKSAREAVASARQEYARTTDGAYEAWQNRGMVAATNEKAVLQTAYEAMMKEGKLLHALGEHTSPRYAHLLTMHAELESMRNHPRTITDSALDDLMKNGISAPRIQQLLKAIDAEVAYSGKLPEANRDPIRLQQLQAMQRQWQEYPSRFNEMRREVAERFNRFVGGEIPVTEDGLRAYVEQLNGKFEPLIAIAPDTMKKHAYQFMQSTNKTLGNRSDGGRVLEMTFQGGRFGVRRKNAGSPSPVA